MSQENVEVVRQALARFTGTQELSENIAPDWVWDMSTFRGWPGAREFRGGDAFFDFFRSWIEPYADWVQEVEEVRDAGGDRVVAVLRQRGRLRDSEKWVELRFGHIHTIRDGLIQRTQVYATAEEALEAAGLSA